jgi:hypothetical protein
MTVLPHSAPAERNKQPIFEVLRQVLAPQGNALEMASGTGQHVAWFAARSPRWTWQPTDAEPSALGPIAARVVQERLSNVLAPLLLDVTAPLWFSEDRQFDAIYCSNMLHISPWATCAALMRGSARHLAPSGVLITYGPYLEHEVPTSRGNLAFDQSLRARDPAWGIRRREDVEQEAQRAGLCLSQRHEMPANNLLLVWSRTP